MKTALFVLVLSAATLVAQPAGDPELQTILDFAKPPARPAEGAKRSETLRANDDAAQKLRTLGLAYLATHPSGSDRARVILALDERPPMFIKEFKPGFDESPSGTLIVRDMATYEAWNAELENLVRNIRNDPTVEPALQTQALRAIIAPTMWAAKTALELAKVQAMIEELAATDEKAAVGFLSNTGMFYVYAMLGVPALEQYLTGIAANPREALAAPAREALATLANQQAKAGRIAFTAVDGREVDLAKLRGKVVLVDFWATWCGPCIRELPNLKAVYAAYHDKGFEIVGITLENGKLAPNDTPEKTTEKLAKAKKVLTDFTAKNKMPWPQYFDGKYWKSDISTEYAIKAIPAMFLLDQEGKLVSTNARGGKLEEEVKRLLKGTLKNSSQ